MTPDAAAEIAMCNECISHLLENAGPDHIIVKYRAALIKLQEQAEEIKRLEDALVEERKGLECAGCGKRYEDVRGKSGKDGDLLLGEIRLDPGSPANHVEPEISYEIYFWCVECMEEGEQLRGGSDQMKTCRQMLIEDA